MLDAFELLLKYGVLALISVIVYLVDKRVGQRVNRTDELKEVKAEQVLLRQRLSEISSKVGLTNIFK